MSSGRKTLGFSLYINLPLQAKGIPSRRNVVNNFDYIGDLVSTRRIENESNIAYKNRIWDASVHPSGPLYEGVVNGIARDLGYLRVKTLKIELKLDSSGDPVATSPRVDILANQIIMYSDWRLDGTEVIDKQIRTYQLNDTGYYLNDLVAEINTSDYFSASIYTDIRSNTITSTLIKGTTDYIVIDEQVRADKLIQLALTNVTSGSMSFSEKDIFKTEVTSDPAAEGEYKIDYINGELYTYDSPSGNGTCMYHAAIFPMEVDSVPVQIFSLHDDNFRDEMFSKSTLDSGEETNSLPNTEGSEILHQLFLEADIFWGK